MEYMQQALELAQGVLGTVNPNPAVGAVLVNNGYVVGEGATQPPGGCHAEVVALKQAGNRARGATLYATLEPCNHQGRTPPCTSAIIDAGVSEVHVALTDPNPEVIGGGLQSLQKVGISTRVGECEKEAKKVLEAYLHYVKTGLPFVTVKFASTLDGKIATRLGDSKWISNLESRRYVHNLRVKSDSVMTGINTVLSDDPKLTARDSNNIAGIHQPLRVILDSHGRFPLKASMIRQPGQTLVVVADTEDGINKKIRDVGVEVCSFPNADGKVSLIDLMKYLGERGVTSLLVEGGGILLGSLFDAQLVDKVFAFVSPILIGGKKAPSPVAGLGVDMLLDAHNLHDVEIKQFGSDVAIIG